MSSYNPSVAARQLGFGQVPPKLCFTDVIKPREPVDSSLTWGRVWDLEPSATKNYTDLTNWNMIPFYTEEFKNWWSEWRVQIFDQDLNLYRSQIYDKYKLAERKESAPTKSKSGRDIRLSIVMPISVIGCRAPSLADICVGKVIHDSKK